jgi:O-antigen/teichoic acid export membrane protein
VSYIKKFIGLDKSMAKVTLFSNSIFYTLIGFFPLAIGFFTMPIMTRYLSPEDYGLLALIATFTSLLPIIASFQLYSGVKKFYFEYEGNEKNTYFSTIFYSLFIVSMTLISCLVLWGDLLVNLMFKSQSNYFPYFFIASINVSCALLMGVTTAFFKVEERARELLEVSTIATLVGVVLTLYFVIIENMGIFGALVGTLSTTLLIVSLHLYKLKSKFVLSFKFQMLVSNFRFGLPVVPHALGGYLFMYSDKIILDKYVGLAMIGIYAVSDRFASLYKIVVSAFSNAFVPVFMKACKESISSGQALVTRVSEIWFVVLGLGYYLLINTGEYLVYIMTPEQYHEAALLIPILTLAYVCRGVYILPINTFYYMKKTKYLPLATITSGIMNVTLNILIIPYIGIYGAAITTVLSFAFNLWAIEYLTRYTFKVTFNRSSVITLFVILILSNLIFYLTPSDDYIFRIVVQIIGLIVVLAILFTFDIGKIRTYLRRGKINGKSLYNR